MADAKIPTIGLAIKKNKGITTFKGKHYIKYTVYDSTGHYFTKLLHNEYKEGDIVQFAVHSYKGEISLKAVE